MSEGNPISKMINLFTDTYLAACHGKYNTATLTRFKNLSEILSSIQSHVKNNEVTADSSRKDIQAGLIDALNTGKSTFNDPLFIEFSVNETDILPKGDDLRTQITTLFDTAQTCGKQVEDACKNVPPDPGPTTGGNKRAIYFDFAGITTYTKNYSPTFNQSFLMHLNCAYCTNLTADGTVCVDCISKDKYADDLKRRKDAWTLYANALIKELLANHVDTVYIGFTYLRYANELIRILNNPDQANGQANKCDVLLQSLNHDNTGSLLKTIITLGKAKNIEFYLSYGGQNYVDLQNLLVPPEDLDLEAYFSAIKKFGFSGLDFDLEGSWGLNLIQSWFPIGNTEPTVMQKFFKKALSMGLKTVLTSDNPTQAIFGQFGPQIGPQKKNTNTFTDYFSYLNLMAYSIGGGCGNLPGNINNPWPKFIFDGQYFIGPGEEGTGIPFDIINWGFNDYEAIPGSTAKLGSTGSAQRASYLLDQINTDYKSNMGGKPLNGIFLWFDTGMRSMASIYAPKTLTTNPATCLLLEYTECKLNAVDFSQLFNDFDKKLLEDRSNADE